MTSKTLSAVEATFMVIAGDAANSMHEAMSTLSPNMLDSWRPGCVWTPPTGTRWPGGGLMWQSQPGAEVARLASVAREECGAARTWDEVKDIASYALDELQLLAQGQADEFNAAATQVEAWIPSLGESSAEDMIALHGAATILASGMLWSLRNEGAASLFNRPLPSASALTGANVMSAFALLMIDHAAHEAHRGYAMAAVEFLGIGAQALNYATMDKTLNDAASQVFQKNKSGAIAAARAKNRAVNSVREEVLQKYREDGAGEPRPASRRLASFALELSRRLGGPLTEDSAADRVYKWLLEDRNRAP